VVLSLHTPLCDLLGIEVPILQAGMGMGARARLAGAVSRAGGLGVIGAAGLAPEEIEAQLREVRSITDRPVGVDLLFPGELAGAEALSGIRAFLAEAPPQAREDLAELERLAVPGWVEAQVDAALGAGASVIVSGLGSPARVIERCHRAGARVLALAGTPQHAAQHEADGVDAVIASGSDAGGHTGRIGSVSLWTAVLSTARVPVVAAGGISDGRGVAAALAAGCSGVWVGTRFIATPEADVHPRAKARLLAASTTDTVVTKAYSGKPMRVLRNRFTDRWEGRATLGFPFQIAAAEGLGRRGLERGDVENGAVQAGQGVGLVTASEPAGDVVRRLVDEAAVLLGRAAGWVTGR
jgi:enoyl-[acyl-carrier protein] reductase II